MIKRDQDNVILWCRELCQQFMVDMYVKIESERFQYLRFNQKKAVYGRFSKQLLDRLMMGKLLQMKRDA
jgi:hypothetical protein